MIKRFIPVAVAAAAFAVPATAATTITITPTPNPCAGMDCSFSIAGSITDIGAFEVSEFFTIPQIGNVGSSLTNIQVSAATNIDFTNVNISDGVNTYTFDLTVNGNKSMADLNATVIQGGTYKLTVAGTSGGNASFGGDISFGAVPEASTWAFMIVGFGLIGGALRRTKARPALRYA